MDTPLHNATRWNHPSLVKELLLYGASYTATNNDSKTPLDLTSDDQVHILIWKASKGMIPVGSYSPLVRYSNRASQSRENSFSPLGLGKGKGEGMANPKDNTARSLAMSHDPVKQSHDFSKESSESGRDEKEDYVVIEEEDVLEHRPIGSQQEAEFGKEEGVERVELEDKPCPEGRELRLQQRLHDPHSNKLIALLKAIEDFDRYVLFM